MDGLLGPIPPSLLPRVKVGLLQLTPTEIRVLQWMTAGHPDPAIGEQLGITRGTVEVHTLHIMKKTGCSRYQLIRAACELKDDAEVLGYLARRTGA